MRKDFGKLNGGAIEYAPDTLRDGGSYIVAPRPEDYARLGWLPVVDEPPTTPPREGFHYEARGWAVEDGRNVRQYAEVADPPPPPRVFRRSYLAQWIRGAGKWAALESFLLQPGYSDIAFFWQYSTEFDEDHAAWPSALAAIKAALSLTDEDADAMLDFGATGGQP